MLILLALEKGERRFGHLRQRVDGISDKVLTQRLGTLVADNLIERTSRPEIPPRVDYRLTPLGRSALAPIHELFEWTVQHMDDVVGGSTEMTENTENNAAEKSAAPTA